MQNDSDDALGKDMQSIHGSVNRIFESAGHLVGDLKDPVRTRITTAPPRSQSAHSRHLHYPSEIRGR
jgi:hypothetical protein